MRLYANSRDDRIVELEKNIDTLKSITRRMYDETDIMGHETDGLFMARKEYRDWIENEIGHN